LIAPARRLTARFAAIAVYVGYRERDGMPSFYVLEAGTATGEPAVLYLSKTMTTHVDERAGYEPTPFSSPDNIVRLIERNASFILVHALLIDDLQYRATLTMNELGTDPTQLKVACFWPGFDEPYLVTTVAYLRGAQRTRELPTKLLIVSGRDSPGRCFGSNF
jgi:hypothetical protein